MSDHRITVDLPESVFDPIRRIAEAKDQSVAEIVVDQLRSVLSVPMPSLPADEESELVAFKFLSDDTLLNIVREQMLRPDQEQMQVLMDRNNFGTITPQEYDQLSNLVERGQRLMLRKAWAAGVLMERGHNISAQDFTPDDE
jgi:YD repeat-containing protein